MIYVKKINGSDMVLNCELIECVEATPDTTITLNNGKKIMLSDSVDDVVQKVIDYRRKTIIKDINV